MSLVPEPAAPIGTVACVQQRSSARLAVAPRYVDDPPAIPRLQELKEINVERAANGGARDAFRHVVDFDLDPAIVDVLSLPLTARGHIDHLLSRERANAFSARSVLLERALGQLRMKRSLHPGAIPVEPSPDVVARCALDRGFVPGCDFLGPDGISLWHQLGTSSRPLLPSHRGLLHFGVRQLSTRSRQRQLNPELCREHPSLSTASASRSSASALARITRCSQRTIFDHRGTSPHDSTAHRRKEHSGAAVR
jgi:hypothetical protein